MKKRGAFEKLLSSDDKINSVTREKLGLTRSYWWNNINFLGMWSWIKSKFISYSTIALVILAAVWIVKGVKLPKFSDIFPKSDVKIVERIIEVPVIEYRTKWKTKWKTKYQTKYVRNPLNKELKESNRILRHRARSLERRLASLNHEYLVNKKIIDDFYSKPIKKGWERRMRYRSNCGPLDKTSLDNIIVAVPR